MSIVLVGSSSGSITLQEPAVAGTTTLNLPATSGTVALTSDVIGVSQNWTIVLGSRAFDTTYTNSTGKPITVWVGGSCTAGNEAAVGYIFVNAVALGPTAGAAGAKWQATFIVPNGQTYYVTKNSGTPSLEQWVELR
jgi:hypothetical protein